MSIIPIYCIDFEGNARCGILEYGVVELIGKKITRTWTRFCKPLLPEERIPWKNFSITHKDCNNQLSFSEEGKLFTSFRKTGVFAAHQASFDQSLLRVYWPYVFSVPNFFHSREIHSWGPWIDTKQIYSQLLPKQSLVLKNIIERLGLSEALSALAELYCPVRRKQFHCALYDALAVAVLLQYVLDRIGEIDQPARFFIEKSCPFTQEFLF